MFIFKSTALGVQTYACIRKSDGELVAITSPYGFINGVFRVCWYGGEKHGKVEIVRGGLPGVEDALIAEETRHAA